MRICHYTQHTINLDFFYFIYLFPCFYLVILSPVIVVYFRMEIIHFRLSVCPKPQRSHTVSTHPSLTRPVLLVRSVRRPTYTYCTEYGRQAKVLAWSHLLNQSLQVRYFLAFSFPRILSYFIIPLTQEIFFFFPHLLISHHVNSAAKLAVIATIPIRHFLPQYGYDLRSPASPNRLKSKTGYCA